MSKTRRSNNERNTVAVLKFELDEARQQLSEALEQQTATSEVLKIISSSPGELAPVLQAMLENATRICEAKFGTLYLWEGDAYRVVALHGAPPAYAEKRRHEPIVRPPPGTGLARVVATGYLVRDPRIVALVELAGARSLVAVPMLNENELVGSFAIYRQEVGRSPTSRSKWYRISPARRSLPSRMCASSTSCGNLWNNRPQQPCAQGHQPLDLRSAGRF